LAVVSLIVLGLAVGDEFDFGLDPFGFGLVEELIVETITEPGARE